MVARAIHRPAVAAAARHWRSSRPRSGAALSAVAPPAAEVEASAGATKPERRWVDFGRRVRLVDPAVELVDGSRWDVVCDVRSPGEYAEDHVPGALSTPVLDNDERKTVGTVYKQVNPFEAKKLGSALVAANLGRIIESHFLDRPKETRVLVYCWRGGDRSQALAHTLSRIGFGEVALVERGYKGYRAQVKARLDALGGFNVHVVAGQTGSAKGKLLESLRKAGGQVIDLEVCADHKGSVLGEELHANFEQPSQKLFETRVAKAAMGLDPTRPLFVEGEGSLIGKCAVPQELWAKMKVADVTEVHLPMEHRVAWLRSQYTHFETTHVGRLKEKLAVLVRKRGHATVDRWNELVDAGRWDEFVEDMLVEHYDEVYAHAAERDRGQSPGKRCDVSLADLSDGEYDRAARDMLAQHDPAALGA